MNYDNFPRDPDHEAFGHDGVAFINSLNEPLAFHDTPQAHEAPDARAAAIFLETERDVVFEQGMAAFVTAMETIVSRLEETKAKRADRTPETLKQVHNRIATKATFDAMVADLPDAAEDTTIAPMARAAMHLADAEPKVIRDAESALALRAWIKSQRTSDDLDIVIKRNAEEYGNRAKPRKGVSLRKPDMESDSTNDQT